MPAYWRGTSAPSSMCRTNRSGGGVGTSPGINPITPYTTAALDYRASWISGDVVAKSKEFGSAANVVNKRWGETMRNEEQALANSLKTVVEKSSMPPPHHGVRYYESNGLERSLATNIPDHPAAIQVNSLRQERTVDIVCKGHVVGVNSYDSRTLVGNWCEERCDKAHIPSAWKASTGNDWRWRTTYDDMTKHTSAKAPLVKGSNAQTMFTRSDSKFATGITEESTSSNKEIVKLGGIPGVDYQPGDHRSATKPSGNYVNYQCGKQHLLSVIAGRTAYLTPYETTSQAAFAWPTHGHRSLSAERCDVHRPPFQMRDPGRDGKSKMLCGMRTDEFGCERDDPEYLEGHILGKPVPNKQKTYTVGEYRRKWTKSAPEIVKAGMVDNSEHRLAYVTPDLTKIEARYYKPGHVGLWR